MRRKIFVALRLLMLVVVAAALWPSPADAQVRRGRVFSARGYAYSPFFYDPFWGAYPYPYYGAYGIGAQPLGEVRVVATPKQAEVYVDGFYAGVVDDFDGTFQRLRATTGGHVVTLHLEGYRTLTENICVRPGSTLKLQLTMDKLTPGQVSEPPPAPSRSFGGRPAPVPPQTPGA